MLARSCAAAVVVEDVLLSVLADGGKALPTTMVGEDGRVGTFWFPEFNVYIVRSGSSYVPGYVNK